MRILHAFKNYYPPTRGGVEQHLHEVVHSLPGLECSVLTSSASRRFVVDQEGDVQVTRTAEYGRPVSTPLTPSWIKLLNQAQADLLHFHMPNPFGEIALLTSRTRIPMVASYHADIVGRRQLMPLFAPFQQRFLRRAKRIIVGSPRLLDTAEALQAHRDKAVVVPYGVDPALWAQTPPETDEIKSRYPGPIVVCLGRLSYYKGADVLIRAMQGVEATCLIVGTGPKKPDLQVLSKNLGLSDKIVFVGEISDESRAAYMHAAKVFVLPSTSRAESFGIAMLQAMACGTPAISTEVGTGTSWVNQHKKTGLVVPAGDAGSLAAALNTLLGDEVARKEMGVAAAERVEAEFTQRAMLSSLESIYHSLCA